MSAFQEMNQKIEDVVTSAYQKVEETVVNGYKKVEDSVVAGYKSVEEHFIGAFLAREGETVEEARERIQAGMKEGAEE